MDQAVEVGGHRMMLRNLDKVLYPSTGTTKGELLHYVTAVAEVLAPHLRDRALTRKRWPDGVEGQTFFEKNMPRGAPSWIRTVVLPVPGSTMGREKITFPLIDDLAGIVWCANMASLELHVPQWTVGPRGGVHQPDRLVVDLDPGAPAGLPECAELALVVRDRLAEDGLDSFPVTSGGKGMQLYAAVSGTQDADVVRDYAKRLAEELEKAHPRLVVSRMTKVLRKGKVLLDWSQNNAVKTTICPYSPRGRERPTVAAPRTWAELEEAAAGGTPLTQLEFAEVITRVQSSGDPLTPLLPTADAPRGPRGPKVPSRSP